MRDFSYKEYLIPKKNGKYRKIVAPSKDLLAYQKKKLKNLEKIYFKKTNNCRTRTIINGFIPGKNCVTAAEQHIGFKSTVMMDISDFFDSVTRTMFMDPEYIEIFTDNLLFHQEGYCAQGFATSPILANIASLKMVKFIDEYLQFIFDDQYAFTIYADDIQISTNKTNGKDIAMLIIEPIEEYVKRFGFQINSNKTRIRYAHTGYRKILGINVGDNEIRATRKTMRKIRAAKQQKNGPSLGGLVTWSKCMKPKQRK